MTDINPGVTDAHCYQYRLLLTDNVGNTRTVTGTDVTKVDTTVPTVTFNAFTEGTNPNFQYADNAAQKLWYNPAQQGDFQLAINVADVQSAEKKVDFPQLGTNWTPPLADPLLTDSSVPSPFTITYGWDGTVTTPTEPGAQTATGFNNANLTATAGFTVSKDDVLPTGTVANSDAFISVTNVDVNWSKADADSGILLGEGSWVLKRDESPLVNGVCTGFAGTWATTLATDPALSPVNDAGLASGFCYKYEIVLTDNVGNTRHRCWHRHHPGRYKRSGGDVQQLR